MPFYAIEETFIPTLRLRIFFSEQERDSWVKQKPSRRAVSETGARKLFPWFFERKEKQ